jgi:hypothetical protein
MSTPDESPADARQTVVTPLPSPPADGNPTVDLRATQISAVPPQQTDGPVIDLRDGAAPTLMSATVLVPSQTGPPVPAPQPVEVIRFGPGVPVVIAATAATAANAAAVETPPVRKLNGGRALNWAFTLALAAIVAWLLWPTGALHVRAVTAKTDPATVACNTSADVIATVTTNGNPGQLKYRWIRNNGSGSGTLTQSLSRGQHSVNLHLTWTFRGPGTFDARATVQLITPSTSSATVNFRYAC